MILSNSIFICVYKKVYAYIYIYFYYVWENSIIIHQNFKLSGEFRTPLLTLHVCTKKRLHWIISWYFPHNGKILIFNVSFETYLTYQPILWIHLLHLKQEKSPGNFVKVVVVQKGKRQARLISCSKLFPALKLMKRGFIRMRSIQP